MTHNAVSIVITVVGSFLLVAYPFFKELKGSAINLNGTIFGFNYSDNIDNEALTRILYSLTISTIVCMYHVPMKIS